MSTPMDYMRDLRQLVGKRPLIMVGAALLVINPENQLLMIKRTDNGSWGIPGGAMELGEDLEDTVKRETEEEIGIRVSDLELFEVYSGRHLYYRYSNGDEVYNVSVVYLTRNVSGEIHVNPDEHSTYQYFDIQDLPADISPPIQPVLRDLVGQFSHPPALTDPVSVVKHFNQCLNTRDVEGMLRLMTHDCVFENTFPPPDGARYEGQAANRSFWEEFFESSSQAQIEIEDIFALGQRCIMRWKYRWIDPNGQPGHIRGVDIYQVQDGLIAEKLSYVKG